MGTFYVELSSKESAKILAGDGWRFLSFLYWSEYFGMEANDFAPAVMPSK